MEYVCGENEKDRASIVGKMSEETITLPPETLARYAGTYASPGPRPPITIEVEGDHLLMLAGGKVRLLPRTETTFISTRMAVVFEIDERGNAVRMRLRGIEDEIVAERVR